MFGRRRAAARLNKLLDSLARNEISITAHEAQGDGDILRSKFGGRPAVPEGFIWPCFEAANYDGVTANRPLSFLCQINLEEIREYDTEGLLPQSGLLLFFYEQETMRWGFDPEDAGCSRVFYFEDASVLRAAELPDELSVEYRVREYELSFAAKKSYPSFEELELYTDAEDIDSEDYDGAVEAKGYTLDPERHKLLGYADLVQGEMLTECEEASRGLYSGNPESCKSTPAEVKNDIQKAASDWVLLFQMTSIEGDGFELMFGDLGNVYFYIRRQELRELRFDGAWLVLQCG